MKRNIIVAIIIGAAIALPILLMSNLGITRQDSSGGGSSIVQDDTTAFATVTNDEGAVSVAVTPKDISERAVRWDFEISLNTHSVELDEDMMRSVTLYDDRKREYKPIEWVGDVSGGHHRNGVLTFQSISPLPEMLLMKVSDVGGVKERVFQWDIPPKLKK